MTDPETPTLSAQPDRPATHRAQAVTEAQEARDDQGALEAIVWWLGHGHPDDDRTQADAETTDQWVGLALEALDDAGWEFRRVVTGPEPVPTTLDDRMALVKALVPAVSLEAVDQAARYVATGRVPGTEPTGTLSPTLAGPELANAAEALAEWEGYPPDAPDLLDRAAALAHAVRALLNAAS